MERAFFGSAISQRVERSDSKKYEWSALLVGGA